eukprot:5348653-Prymnesium_polylepis.1
MEGVHAGRAPLDLPDIVLMVDPVLGIPRRMPRLHVLIQPLGAVDAAGSHSSNTVQGEVIGETRISTSVEVERASIFEVKGNLDLVNVVNPPLLARRYLMNPESHAKRGEEALSDGSRRMLVGRAGVRGDAVSFAEEGPHLADQVRALVSAQHSRGTFVSNDLVLENGEELLNRLI